MSAPTVLPIRIDLKRYLALAQSATPMRVEGRVSEVTGLLAEVAGIPGRLGEMCVIECSGQPVQAEIVGFRGNRTLVMPLGDLRGVQAGTPVVSASGLMTVPVGEAVLGRVLDGMGRPIDDLGPVLATQRAARSGPSPHVLTRQTITEPLSTGIRAIDGLLTCGLGQRIGIFAGSGVGGIL